MSDKQEFNKTVVDDDVEIIENERFKKVPKKPSNFKKNLPIIILVVSVSIFSLLAGSMCTKFFESINKQNTTTASRFNGNYGSVDTPIDQQSGENSSGSMGGQNRGGMGFFNSTSDSSTSFISGVVISVDDSSFVVAGNGKRYTVNTNDSTIYNNTSKSVSINDSVMVSGSLSDTTITATNIRVMNM